MNEKAWAIFAAGLEAHLAQVRGMAEGRFEDALDLCESPIEELFLAAMAFQATDWGPALYGGPLDLADCAVVVTPQVPVGRHRIDFEVRFDTPWLELGTVKIAVECDGHDFHEKTKAQASRDKMRDRYLVASGYIVARFTGAELFADANKCAAEVMDIINKHCDAFADRMLKLP